MGKTLYLERSTGECRKGDWVSKLDLADIDRIVVGMGPGSFAGVRSAIAFAQGYALGRPEVGVFGLPSPCALANEGRLAVVGDARQGKVWLALFDGLEVVSEVRQLEEGALAAAIPDGFDVASPDDRRIGEKLKALFGARYRGEALPTAAGLRRFAEAKPAALVPEPLPLYLNPAVRN